MWFGTIATTDALGCIVAHSLRVDGKKISKGRAIDAALQRRIIAGGITELVVARLDDSDVHEDLAAQALGSSLSGAGVVTDQARIGRVNLFSQYEGLLCFDRDSIRAVNAVDEAITLATLPADSWVLPGKMVATSKIISYGVPAERLARAIENVTCRLSVEPVRAQRAVLIQTQLPTIKSTVLDKTRSVTERRLGARHVTLSGEQRCVHEVTALTNVLQSVVDTDLILIAGASAISDRADVVPAAIVEAGGTVHRYGIPVDPGNLLLLGELAGCQVIGLPGCARSAKLNGLDLLLNRIACGVEIDNDWLNGLSVGGLLSEMHDRPQPRVSQDLHRPAKVAALVLAAGTSKRAGPQNKLLCESNGIPMIKRVVDQVTSSRLTDVHVVTGHEHQRVEQALAGSRCKTHYCASYDLGMAHSLSHGISRLGDVDAVMVILGDMPEVSNAVIDQLLAFDSTQIIDTIRVPVFQGTRGNPVIVGKSFFDTLLQHTGDTGAKFLMRQYPDLVVEVPVEEAGVLVDYDTPEALARLNSNC